MLVLGRGRPSSKCEWGHATCNHGKLIGVHSKKRLNTLQTKRWVRDCALTSFNVGPPLSIGSIYSRHFHTHICALEWFITSYSGLVLVVANDRHLTGRVSPEVGRPCKLVASLGRQWRLASGTDRFAGAYLRVVLARRWWQHEGIWWIQHQPTILSLTQLINTSQPSIFFSQNKLSPTISQPSKEYIQHVSNKLSVSPLVVLVWYGTCCMN